MSLTLDALRIRDATFADVAVDLPVGGPTVGVGP